jgi:hypothetical protein
MYVRRQTSARVCLTVVFLLSMTSVITQDQTMISGSSSEYL